jgi:hypothetical protein
MAAVLTVAAKHCRQAEDPLQLAAGFFNDKIRRVLQEHVDIAPYNRQWVQMFENEKAKTYYKRAKT